ncbi:hypothetical protein [Streptomyces sp. NPDC047985]|uniref:hypothetical protein n=1 Tax=unclassified Streptomyces TaxID=2593676 RepID=UPI0034496488
MAYRFWCGECGFKTSWLSESEGARRQMDHYTKQHPGIPPGGHVEANRKNPESGNGCLQLVGVILLLVLIAVACGR